MSNLILTREYIAPPVNKKEVLRYAGCRREEKELALLVDSCISEALGKLTYKVCYLRSALNITGEKCTVGGLCFNSRKLALCFKYCREAVVFAATVGVEPDRLVMKYGSTFAAKALIMQAVGAERIEALCNVFCEDMAKECGAVTSRFSPGYGDLPVEAQKDIFAVLEPEKRIGLYLNGSMLMTPTKSVTAILGIL